MAKSEIDTTELKFLGYLITPNVSKPPQKKN